MDDASSTKKLYFSNLKRALKVELYSKQLAPFSFISMESVRKIFHWIVTNKMLDVFSTCVFRYAEV